MFHIGASQSGVPAFQCWTIQCRINGSLRIIINACVCLNKILNGTDKLKLYCIPENHELDTVLYQMFHPKPCFIRSMLQFSNLGKGTEPDLFTSVNWSSLVSTITNASISVSLGFV